MNIRDWYLYRRWGWPGVGRLSTVLQHGMGYFTGECAVKDRERELAVCGGKGGEVVGGCPEAVQSAVAARSSEADSVQHMQ